MATNANPEYLNPANPGHDEEEVEVESSSALTAIEEADRSHMIRTAKANPRNITSFIQDLTAIACYNQATAMEMMYSVPRDGKQLVGPSIGFAEAALAIWGNARAGSEVVETNAHEGYVVAEGRYYDCERNVGRAIRKRRRIVARRITPDAIQVTGDAACSIATREAILRSIPKPLWKPVWEKAKQTALGEIKSIEQVRVSLVDAFHKMGVTDLQIFNALGIPGMADIGAEEIIALNAWKKQLADRVCTLEDIFGSPLDVEIDQLMAALQWSETKKAMTRDNYKGTRDKLLEYVREQARIAGIETGAKAQPAGTATQVKQQEPERTQEAPPEQQKAEPPAQQQQQATPPKPAAKRTTAPLF